MRSVGLDTRELDLVKYAYDPGQPRFSAGNGHASGEWESTSARRSDEQYAHNSRIFPRTLPYVGGRGGGGGAGPGGLPPEEGIAKTIEIPAGRFGEAEEHIRDAIKAGKPDVLTINRDGAAANRATATGGMTPVPGMHLDEYPPAMFLEGGVGASVRAINPKDNMSIGAHIGNCCRSLPNGARVKIRIGE